MEGNNASSDTSSPLADVARGGIFAPDVCVDSNRPQELTRDRYHVRQLLCNGFARRLSSWHMEPSIACIYTNSNRPTQRLDA